MGLSISTTTEFGPLPHQVTVTLGCDVHKEFFCRGFEHFIVPDGFIGAHSLAVGAGWLERQGPEGRTWLCPACSGK